VDAGDERGHDESEFLDWRSLIDVRHASKATKFCSATK